MTQGNQGPAQAGLPDSKDLQEWAWQATRNREWRLASQRWALVREFYPEKTTGWIQGSIAHRTLGEYDISEVLIFEAVERFPQNSNTLRQYAKLNLVKGEFGKAIELIERARSSFPNDPDVRWSIISTYEASGDFERAEHESLSGQADFPDNEKLAAQYAELAMQQKDWQVALERWQQVREKFPKHAAGYVRAADAAAALGNEPLSRQLKLAQEYGNAWLVSLQDESEGESAHTISPPQRRNWKTFVDLVWTKARLNLKSEASQNHLRYFWWILDPLLYMAVFYIVFGLLMERGGPGFIAYLLTGLVPFQWFAKTVQQTSGSIVGGKGLMHKVRISPLFFPLVGIVQNTGKQALVFLMLGLFLIFYGLPPTVHWLAIVPVIAVQLLLMVVVSCFLAMLVPFVRDISNLIPTGIQFLLFTSGIFYTVDRIPPEWHTLFFSNPMANILHQYRLVLVENQWPDWSGLGWVFLGCMIGLVIVLMLYRRLEPIFPRVVIE
ncbi:ABC transporter permease [Halomonas binhaiensis]|uniref:Transport permease protein n=2 Tax=Halomonas binhaiensis TaxID=2562282 RepID=A0A5C1NK06_9GAMM|nr:ABC transporter permease [Halomonas binhaiensis]